MVTKLSRLLKDHPVVAAALAVTILVYARFLFFGHISWDDPEMVFKNKAVKDFDIKAFFTSHYVGNYIPVTMMLHSLTWQVFGNNDAAHHALNILLHLVNGILVYRIGRRLFQNELVANLGLVLFLLHPIQAESVGWISELKNVASTTFELMAVLSYLHFRDRNQQKLYWLSLLWFVLGCLSKSSVVVLPLTLLCIDLLLEKRFSFSFLKNKIPFLVISLIIGYITIQTQTADQFINHSHEFPYYQRIALAGFALVKYLLLFLFPFHLSVIYPYPDIKPATLIVGFLVLLALGIALFFFFRKKNYTWPALILFVLFNLILVLQLLPFGEALYADRYLYVPLIGLAWMVGLLLMKLKVSPTLICSIAIIVFSAVTLVGNSRWKSAIVLYEDILKKYPNLFIALNSAGVESMFLNEDDKALAYFNKATEVAPRNYKGYYNRGLLHLKNQQPKQAISSFNQALDLYPYNKAYNGRASAYYMLGDIPKAMADAETVLRSEPDNAKAHFVLGNCYNDINKLREALNEYNKCLQLNNTDADFYFKRAIVFGKQQDFQACLSDLTICLELNPNYYEAHYWMGVARMNLKQNPCEDFRIAAANNYEPAMNAYNKYCR